MIAHDPQGGIRRERLLQRVLKRIGGAEDAAEIVVHLQLIAHTAPIDIGAVMRGDAQRDQQDQQHDAAGAEMARAISQARSRSCSR